MLHSLQSIGQEIQNTSNKKVASIVRIIRLPFLSEELTLITVEMGPQEKRPDHGLL